MASCGTRRVTTCRKMRGLVQCNYREMLMDEKEKRFFWRLRMTSRETLIAAVVGALAIGVFLGVIRVMAPESPSPEATAPQASASAPAAMPAPDAQQPESAS